MPRRKDKLPPAQRDFPYRDTRGVWRHPKTGRQIKPDAARRILSTAYRSIAVRNVVNASGLTEKAVRSKLKGISTNDLLGKWQYVEYLDANGNRLSGDDRKKAVTIRQVRGHKQTVLDEKTGKKRRVLEEGPNAKGRKALERLGVVMPLGRLLSYGDRGQRSGPQKRGSEARARKAPRVKAARKSRAKKKR